jgi:ubiquinone/menaquinone biosynthesis C-methylase UbiE
MPVNASIGFRRPVPTAKWYVALTNESLEDSSVLARRIAEKIPARASVLEVAPGPGHFAIELAKRGDYKIAGLDQNETSVETARANAAAAGVQIDFRRGDGSNMPFSNESFDFLVCRAALRNFADPQGALAEMHRVLKPGGRALIFDLRRFASQAAAARAENETRSVVSGIAAKLPFQFMQLKRAYTKSELEEFIAEIEFHDVELPEGLTELAAA